MLACLALREKNSRLTEDECYEDDEKNSYTHWLLSVSCIEKRIGEHLLANKKQTAEFSTRERGLRKTPAKNYRRRSGGVRVSRKKRWDEQERNNHNQIPPWHQCNIGLTIALTPSSSDDTYHTGCPANSFAGVKACASHGSVSRRNARRVNGWKNASR